ncbi:MAG: hypothetical protein IH819_10035, partial [Bacteroidetes bacterium]|nr:hypothetical protein [Bacteroidota bacterium]
MSTEPLKRIMWRLREQGQDNPDYTLKMITNAIYEEIGLDERTIKNNKNEDEKIKEHFDYKVQINEIKKLILPELNEEFIKKVTKDKVSNVEDLKKEIRKDIQYYYDQREKEILRGKLMNMIIKNNDFTPPTTMVNNIVEHLVKNEKKYSKKQRIPIPSHEE